jgi:hypothetical protein
MNPSIEGKTEHFTGAELKEARKQFNDLREQLNYCSQLSKNISKGKFDFDEILTCLYTIEKNPMYNFLSKHDPTFKSIIDVTFLRLKNVGGVIRVSMNQDEAEAKETKKLEKDMEKLEALVEAKGDIEGNLKRTFDKIVELEQEEENESMSLTSN